MDSCNDCSRCFRSKGALKDHPRAARHCFCRPLQQMETRKRVLGHDHLDKLTSMNNLAFTLKEHDKKEEAIKPIA